jgi:hypothetical protein
MYLSGGIVLQVAGILDDLKCLFKLLNSVA